MLTKVYETRTVHVRCIYIKKIVTTLELSVKGYGDGASEAADWGLGAEGGGKGLKLFLPPKKQFGLITMHQYKQEV